MTTILLLGDHRGALTAARSLHARGWRVVAPVASNRESHLRASRAVDVTIAGPPTELTLEWLTEVIETWSIDVVLPIGDSETHAVATIADMLRVATAIPDPTIVATCQEKDWLLERAVDLDLGVPPYEVVTTLSELGAAAKRIGFPVFVKANEPDVRLHGCKGLSIRTPAVLDRVVPEWPDADALIVQRLVDGPRHNLYFAAVEGEIAGIGEVVIHRTDRPDGSGLAVDGETVAPTDLGERTEALVRDLKYTGVGCAQYLVAPDGETAFLEINPRLGANHEAVRAAGLDLAAAAVDIALGDEPQVPKTARPGVRYAWGLGDLDAIVRALRHREIGFGEAARWFGRTLRSVRAADTHVVWQRTDPRPGAALMWAVVVRPLLGVLASRLSGRRA